MLRCRQSDFIAIACVLSFLNVCAGFYLPGIAPVTYCKKSESEVCKVRVCICEADRHRQFKNVNWWCVVSKRHLTKSQNGICVIMHFAPHSSWARLRLPLSPFGLSFKSGTTNFQFIDLSRMSIHTLAQAYTRLLVADIEFSCWTWTRERAPFESRKARCDVGNVLIVYTTPWHFLSQINVRYLHTWWLTMKL